MKKIAIILSLFICSQVVLAQGWMEIGLKGGYGVNFLINKNFYSDHNFSPKLSSGYMFGGKIGINFNESHSITIDVTSSVFEQKYNYSTLNADSVTRTIYSGSVGFNTLDFLLMYRKASDGGYIEIGPQYSLISNVKMKSEDPATLTSPQDPSPNMVKSYYAAAFGFGGYLVGTENFRITIGFRASYGLSDLVSSTGKQNGFPINKYENYKATSPLTGMMILEMNYDVGYFARSKCKKRKLRFLLF